MNYNKKPQLYIYTFIFLILSITLFVVSMVLNKGIDFTTVNLKEPVNALRSWLTIATEGFFILTFAIFSILMLTRSFHFLQLKSKFYAKRQQSSLLYGTLKVRYSNSLLFGYLLMILSSILIITLLGVLIAYMVVIIDFFTKAGFKDTDTLVKFLTAFINGNSTNIITNYPLTQITQSTINFLSIFIFTLKVIAMFSILAWVSVGFLSFAVVKPTKIKYY